MASSIDATSAAGNSARVQRLQQTLHDVLSDLSLDGMAAGPSPAAASASSLFASPSASSTANFSHLFGNTGGNPGFSAAMRPSAALGVSTEDLLLAAAAEKRRLNANAAYIRQRALEERLFRQQQQQHQQQQQQKGSSLLGLFHHGLPGGLAGMCGAGANLSHDSVGSLLAYKHGWAARHHPSVYAAAAASSPGLLNSKQLQYSHQAAAAAATPAITVPKDIAANSNSMLEALGTSLRKSTSPYVDVAALEADVDPTDPVITKTRGGVTDPFPQKLHRMLEYAKEIGKEDVVSFYSHGRAFGIHDPDAFSKDIMPKFFKQSRLSSFQRQLNLYGFRRITTGPDAGGYYHELFLKARPKLCLHMRRVGLPKGEDRRKLRSKNVLVEPDFYNMRPAATGGAGV